MMKNRVFQARIEMKLAKPKTSNLIPHETQSKNVLPFIVEVLILIYTYFHNNNSLQDYRDQIRQTLLDNNSKSLFMGSPSKISHFPSRVFDQTTSPFTFEERIFSPFKKNKLN